MFRFLILLAFVIIGPCAEADTSLEAKSCQYGKPSECSKNEFCINIDKEKSGCQKSFDGKLITISFPFSSAISIMCDQGPLSPPTNSHTWMNTAFALDLQSDRKLEEVAVFAGAHGKAIVFDGCSTENDQCGLGFGNSVKILNNDGYLIFYAHLKKVLIKTGDEVKPGDQIGIEGTTGWTGEGNRHLHLSVHYDWRQAGHDYWKNTGYLPLSVPFKISMCQKCSANCKSSEVDIRNIDCIRTFKNASPICKGN
jgi:hypothetical protein